MRRYLITWTLFLSLTLPLSLPAAPCEKELQDAQTVLRTFDDALPLHERTLMKNVAWEQRRNLLPSVRERLEKRQSLKEKVSFWNDTCRLKDALLALKPVDRVSSKRPRSEEAQQIAETAIQGFGELKKNYRMLRPAVLQNALINSGLKKQGFCWHWTRDLMHRIEKLPLAHYDFQWATAYKGKLREHNTLVMIPRGAPLEDGLLLDGWRHSGKPFWTLVKNDKKYPWKPGEFLGIENEDER